MGAAWQGEVRGGEPFECLDGGEVGVQSELSVFVDEDRAGPQVRSNPQPFEEEVGVEEGGRHVPDLLLDDAVALRADIAPDLAYRMGEVLLEQEDEVAPAAVGVLVQAEGQGGHQVALVGLFHRHKLPLPQLQVLLGQAVQVPPPQEGLRVIPHLGNPARAQHWVV
jgi:hypothetical protein